VRPVKGQPGQGHGFTAGGQQDRAGLDEQRPLRRATLFGLGNGHPVSIHQAGRTLNHSNPVTFQEFPHILAQLPHDLVLARHHGSQIERDPIAENPVSRQAAPGRVVGFAGIQQGLAGNAADVEADAAESWSFLEADHFQAELGGPHRGHITARSGANDAQVDLFALRHFKSPA